MAAAPPVPEVLQAPGAWLAADFISDLHLHAQDLVTLDAWRQYMGSTPADAVFILGDLFEVWVGDDSAAAPGFLADCAAVLQASARSRPTFFMHGNRDFLVGRGFLDSCGVTLLEDPTVLDFAGKRWLLTHGDALCLADTDYMQFRNMVRTPAWQREFLAKPLAEREAIAAHMRRESESHKRTAMYVDPDATAVDDLLRTAGALDMIHGHTHRPADHDLGSGRRRIVLSDWDAGASPARQEVLRVTAAGTQRLALA